MGKKADDRLISLREAVLELARRWEDEKDQAILDQRRGETKIAGNGVVMYVGTLATCAIELKALIKELEQDAS